MWFTGGSASGITPLQRTGRAERSSSFQRGSVPGRPLNADPLSAGGVKWKRGAAASWLRGFVVNPDGSMGEAPMPRCLCGAAILDARGRRPYFAVDMHLHAVRPADVNT